MKTSAMQGSSYKIFLYAFNFLNQIELVRGPNIRTIFNKWSDIYVMKALVRIEILPDINERKSKLIRWNALDAISSM